MFMVDLLPAMILDFESVKISNSLLSHLSDVTTSGIHLYSRVSVILFRCLLPPHDHDPPSRRTTNERRRLPPSSSARRTTNERRLLIIVEQQWKTRKLSHKIEINVSSHHSKTITLIEQQVFTMLNHQYLIMDDKVVTPAAEVALRGKNGERIAPPKDKGMKHHIGVTTVAGGLTGLLRLCNGSGRCRYVRQLSRQGSR
jgi:hypothetical protein